MVFVDKSITGAFVALLLLAGATAVVDVGEGELDEALYGKGANEILLVKKYFETISQQYL